MRTLLLDDDLLIRLAWRHAAQAADVSFEAFETAEALLARLAELRGAEADTRIYVDAQLGDGVRGEAVAQEVARRGFHDVYLATGYPTERFRHVTWVRGVVGKDPPFSLSSPRT